LNTDEFTREFAEMLNIDPASLRPNTDLTQLPEWDSVAYLSAMVLIDERLAISIRPDLLSNARSFGEILSAVQHALKD
jgi:acyl carrier protein